MRQCGNEVIVPENEDAFTIEVLYNLLCRNESILKPLKERVRDITDKYKSNGLTDDTKKIPAAECSIMARDLSWDWIGDAHERFCFSVDDLVLVRISSVRRETIENISIKADIKSVSQNTSHDNLKKCRIQSKYAGKVTDVYKGVVYIRLTNGVNAVAHSCFDHRTPGKKDDVSFAVTKLDEERGVAVGIITRIIRQNL